MDRSVHDAFAAYEKERDPDAPATRDNAKIERAYREYVRRRVFRDKDIPYLISLMSAVDPRDGTTFTFKHIREPLEPGEVWLDGNKLRSRDKNWRWQRHVVDRARAKRRTIDLKGRQIGDTWITLATDVGEALTMPGTASLLYRQRHDDAVDNVRRWWSLYCSLPEWLTGHIKAVKPEKADRPGIDGVVLKFPDGSFSEITPMSSAKSSGHGRTVRRVMLDEAAHIENLLSIRAAIEPAAGQAHISVISTANGRSDPESGLGNEFHRLWVTAEESGYDRLFLPFDLHPDRDAAWYESDPEIVSLPVWKRQEQFPRDEHEAFALSDRSFFDPDALLEYASRVKSPLYRFDFVEDGPARARVSKHSEGRIRVYAEPVEDHTYAVGADVATGRGADYSAAYVIDLQTMELAAEYHGKVEADIYARDLHYLGRRYGTARLAIESSGGYGEAVIVPLRDGVAGRPAYPKLYQHVLSARPDKPLSKPFGFPTNTKTRPLILNQLEQHLRERTLPWVSGDLLHEMTEFVHHDHGPSPRARSGSRDDRVMACAIAFEMYRLYGHHPKRNRPRSKKSRVVGLGRTQGVQQKPVDSSRYRAA